MRWYDIILPEPGTDQVLDQSLAEAAALAARFPQVQARDGMDALGLMPLMEETGRCLFTALTRAVPHAFDRSRRAATLDAPAVGETVHDALAGFHLVVDACWLGLPWGWLHNGLNFILEQHPLCASLRPAALPPEQARRPWMQRQVRAGFLVGDGGAQDLRSVRDQLQSPGARLPELLFIPGHTDPRMRRLIYREAEMIAEALGAGVAGRPLARLEVPVDAVTPRHLCDQNVAYQILHFAGPTSAPARHDDTLGEYWMNRLLEEASYADDDQVAEAFGCEGEILGVDPVTSLLDDICENHGRQAAHASAGLHAGGNGAAATAGPAAHGGSAAWLLDDGPVSPEILGQRGQLPPLVFSNSWCAVPELGARFVRAGASTFVGPLVPLYSRPARLYAGHLYAGMGRGWCAGAAAWQAAARCRQELGRGHPAWLSYGVLGFGSLALQYL
ncbi:MAG: hypothetical protein IPJ24_11690 [bacterium]|nr:hypothetical protein [bacterium]